jgi:hypothetical protein
MKEVQPVSSDKIEIVKQPEHLKKMRLVGSLIKKPNLVVFEASLITGDVIPAAIELVLTTSGKELHQVKVKENHIYCYALNGKNAVRKLSKMLSNGRNG